MNNMSMARLQQLAGSDNPEDQPCINCIDYPKGCLSDRACSECHPPEYEKFKSFSTIPSNQLENWIMFSERKRIAERVDRLIKEHNIKNDTFGIVCVLAIIGALKRPISPEEPFICEWVNCSKFPGSIHSKTLHGIHNAWTCYKKDEISVCPECGGKIVVVK